SRASATTKESRSWAGRPRSCWESSSRKSFRLHARAFHDLGPALEIGYEQPRELFGRARFRLEALAREPFADIRQRQHGGDLRIEPVHDLRRDARRAHEAVPETRFVAGHARFRDRGQIG